MTAAKGSRKPDIRVALTRQELTFIKSFIENVEQRAWTDRLLDKLEDAIARLDGKPIPRRSPRTALSCEADQRRALCHACGWNGLLTKTSPCPTCGQKVNPLIFDGRTS
jgi:hypothetical protein